MIDKSYLNVDIDGMGLIGIRKQALNTLTARRKIADGDIQPSAVNP